MRALNRLELLGETLRAALNAIAAAAPDWLRAVAPPEWHECGDRRVEGARLPGSAPKRASHAIQTGADGFCLLDAVDGVDAPESVRELPAVDVSAPRSGRATSSGSRQDRTTTARAAGATGWLAVCGSVRLQGARPPVIASRAPTMPRPASAPSAG